MRAIKGRREEEIKFESFQNRVKKNSFLLTVVLEKRKYFVIGGKKTE